MKEYYELKKVVDPHQHMPKTIRAALLEGMQVRELNNDTFINWTVGEYKAEAEAAEEYEYELEEDEESEEVLEYEEDEESSEEEDDYDASMKLLSTVDTWLLKHFKEGEEIIVLYWW